MTKRVLIAGFMHETNTFSQLPTTLDSYKARTLYYGADVATHMRKGKSEIAGFLDACTRHDWQGTSPVFANATPSGKVTEDTFEHVTTVILDCLKDQGPFDGICLALHGAMVCTHTDDGEGELLQRIRAVIGPDVPIAVTLDLHANITDRMAELADIMVIYRTYPHVDQYEVATQAANLLQRTLLGEIKPRSLVVRGQMLDGADHGRTTSPGPMTEVLQLAKAGVAATPGVLAASVAAGFPWADTPDTGPSVVVVGNGISDSCKQLADRLIAEIWRSRNRVTLELQTIDQAIAAVTAAGERRAPIVLADFADNPGGGGYGDGTRLLKAMIDAGLQDAAFGLLYDPVAVRTCIEQGLGAHVVVAIGGKIDGRYGEPIPVTGHVVAVTDGSLRLQGPMMAGTRIEMGPTVVLRVGGIDIFMTSGRFQLYDLNFFQHANLDPRTKAVVAVKSAHHFRAAFAPIASEIIVVDGGGGLTSRNYKQLSYEKVRRPVFPLDLD
ncbi:MAG: M81 family metallopeptidase [Rhodospirillales bacterium]|nr:M81 family metallopeptidase [Rhodospirillales bacterium]